MTYRLIPAQIVQIYKFIQTLYPNPLSPTIAHTMSYNYNSNEYCASSARNCASGCCTFYGNCATTLQDCLYTYYDFRSNSGYTLSNRVSPTRYKGPDTTLDYMSVWAPVSALFLVTIITILVCYCIRKKWVQAVNRFDTDASMISAIINREAHIVPATSVIRHNQFPSQFPSLHYISEGHYGGRNPQMQNTFTQLQLNRSNDVSSAEVPLNDVNKASNRVVPAAEMQLTDEINIQ